MAATRIFSEPPLLPGCAIETNDGVRPLDELVSLDVAEQNRLLDGDETLVLAARFTSLTGIMSWPGALRWQALVNSRRRAPVLAHNAAVVSRLLAADVLACPQNPTRTEKERGPGAFSGSGAAATSLFGEALGEWASGEVSIPSVPAPLVLPEELRRLALAQLLWDVDQLRLRKGEVAKSKELLPFVGVEFAVKYGEKSVFSGDRSSAEDSDVKTDRFALVAENNMSRWAMSVAMALQSGQAGVLEWAGLEPPQPHPGAPSHDELLRKYGKDRWEKVAFAARGLAVVAAVGAAYALGGPEAGRQAGKLAVTLSRAAGTTANKGGKARRSVGKVREGGSDAETQKQRRRQ